MGLCNVWRLRQCLSVPWHLGVQLVAQEQRNQMHDGHGVCDESTRRRRLTSILKEHHARDGPILVHYSELNCRRCLVQCIRLVAWNGPFCKAYTCQYREQYVCIAYGSDEL